VPLLLPAGSSAGAEFESAEAREAAAVRIQSWRRGCVAARRLAAFYKVVMLGAAGSGESAVLAILAERCRLGAGGAFGLGWPSEAEPAAEPAELSEWQERWSWLDWTPERRAAQLRELLECLHDRSIIHRDIKPENVLMLCQVGHSRVGQTAGGGVERTEFCEREERLHAATALQRAWRCYEVRRLRPSSPEQRPRAGGV
jgi:hypothetical protein